MFHNEKTRIMWEEQIGYVRAVHRSRFSVCPTSRYGRIDAWLKDWFTIAFVVNCAAKHVGQISHDGIF